MSLSYRSSDEEMEVDSIYSVHDTAPQDSDEDDIQVIAPYSENQEFPPQLAAGRAMTSDMSVCLSRLLKPTGNNGSRPRKLLYRTIRRANRMVRWKSTVNLLRSTAATTSYSAMRSDRPGALLTNVAATD